MAGALAAQQQIQRGRLRKGDDRLLLEQVVADAIPSALLSALPAPPEAPLELHGPILDAA